MQDITEITRAAKVIREAADAAAADDPQDAVCCWGTDRRGHQDRITETRIDETGCEHTEIIAVPVRGQVAEHIGLWGTGAARAVANWLEDVVELHDPMPEPPAVGVVAATDSLASCHWCNDEDRPCADLRHAFEVAAEILGTKHEPMRACSDEQSARAASLALVH